MQSDTISKAIEIVTRAIQLDNAGKYTEARDQYKTAMQYFVVGLRYEKNEQRKKAVAEQVERYMVRLEELNKGLSEGSIGGQSGGGGAATATRKPGEKGGGGDEGKDSEADQMKSTLASAIVAKKSNVTWNDVAGLEAAKEALKEAVILPVKYPQLFTGERTRGTRFLCPASEWTFLCQARESHGREFFSTGYVEFRASFPFPLCQ